MLHVAVLAEPDDTSLRLLEGRSGVRFAVGQDVAVLAEEVPEAAAILY